MIFLRQVGEVVRVAPASRSNRRLRSRCEIQIAVLVVPLRVDRIGGHHLPKPDCPARQRRLNTQHHPNPLDSLTTLSHHRSLRSNRSRRTRISLLTDTSQTARTGRFSFISRRAKRTNFVGIDADRSVVFAEDHARDVFGHVFGTHVRVQWDVRGAFEVVRVFVEAHCAG
jgi:hypothetical protein